MKELIARDDLGVFADGDATARVDSLFVARVFGKAHDKVIRDIRKLDCSAEFNAANFGDISYTDSQGRRQRAVSMTRDGFTFLVTGMSARQFREARGIRKGESIRPYLTPDEARMMDDLQRVDIGLLVAVPDFKERKAALTAYRDRRAALIASQ